MVPYLEDKVRKASHYRVAAGLYGREESTLRRNAMTAADKLPGGGTPIAKLERLCAAMIQGSSSHPRAHELF